MYRTIELKLKKKASKGVLESDSTTTLEVALLTVCSTSFTPNFVLLDFLNLSLCCTVLSQHFISRPRIVLILFANY